MLLWNAIEWTRPWGFAALLLPLLILIFARERGDPSRKPTGALEIWRRVDALLPALGGQKERMPPGTYSLLAALCLGALALAGPMLPLPPMRSTWTLVVDRSRSMHLEHGEGGTRLERALTAARELLDEVGASEDLLRWQSPNRATLILPLGEQPNAEWLRGEPWTQAPRWSSWREAGCIWVTGHDPTAVPAMDVFAAGHISDLGSAGLVASGGVAVEGPIEIGPSQQVLFEAGELKTIESPWEPPFVELRGEHIPEPVERILTVWCAERGLELRHLKDSADWEAILSSKAALQWICAQTSQAPRAVVAGRDGWIAAGMFLPEAPPDPMRERSWEAWLTGSNDEWLIANAPGLIWSSWVEMQEPGGDPAAFALSIGKLCDQNALAAEQVIPLIARMAAGGARVVKPESPIASSESERNAWQLPIWLIAACALFAVHFLWRRFGSPSFAGVALSNRSRP